MKDFARVYFFLSVFLSISAQSNEFQGTITTSKGVVFQVVRDPSFGKSILAPDGTIWSRVMGNILHNNHFIGGYTNGNYLNHDQVRDGVVISSPAVDLCRDAAAELPKMEDYDNLLTYFDTIPFGDGTRKEETAQLTDHGLKDLLLVFPDMLDEGWGKTHRYFWTSSTLSSDPSDRDLCITFEPQHRGTHWRRLRNYNGLVRCIHRKHG